MKLVTLDKVAFWEMFEIGKYMRDLEQRSKNSPDHLFS